MTKLYSLNLPLAANEIFFIKMNDLGVIVYFFVAKRFRFQNSPSEKSFVEL
jgi:hypothetical protein